MKCIGRKDKYVEVLAAVDTIWPGDFGGMRVLQSHKEEKYKGCAEFESRGKQLLEE